MGRATRWFKGLLGMKKDKDRASSSSSVSGAEEKRRWSIGKSSAKDSDMPSTKVDSAWLRSYITETEHEQNKHAIAVAAATAAAADAAMAAAQAAVAVVRLTSQGRGVRFCNGDDQWAAVKIQTVFRGFLSRKALRALKGLVKLQALVRGYLVRKRTAATLHSMQALIRAQAAARSSRASRALNKENRFSHENRLRRSTERYDDTRSELHSKRISCSYELNNGFDDTPKIVEIDTFKPKSRSRRMSNVLTDVSSPNPCPVRLSIPSSRQLEEFDWCFTGEECRFSTTAHSTPRFTTPPTPPKSLCGERPYMATTQSFNAKLRSLSAPKQRPEPVGPRKRLSLHEIMAARNSMSSVRSCNHHLHEVLNQW